MAREDDIRRASADYEAALKSVRETKPGKGTSGVEARLGSAYQRLVRLGARPQLKLKYRG
jgi:hypothetical protein